MSVIILSALTELNLGITKIWSGHGPDNWALIGQWAWPKDPEKTVLVSLGKIREVVLRWWGSRWG